MSQKLQDALNLIPDATIRTALSQAFDWLKQEYDGHTHHVQVGEDGLESSGPMHDGQTSQFPEK